MRISSRVRSEIVLSLRAAARSAFALSALACLPACSGAAAPPEPVDATELAIMGGYIDKKDTAVVGLAISLFNGTGEICSGTLIAPNVVLTAHHCVAPVLGEGPNGINCKVTFFGATYPPNYFAITTADLISDTFSGSHNVQEILVPPGGNLICGFDQAILILTDLVDPIEAVPRAPRVDVPATKGEQYSAIGFGGTDDNGDGAGQRRRRDKLFVDCVGAACPKSQQVTETEIGGDTGICHGDSGGPAVDALGRVVGVTSRGTGGCANPTYGAVYAWSQWIMDTTKHASWLAGAAPPAWVNGGSTDPQYALPVGAACTQPSECPSGHCVADASPPYCTRLCNDLTPCPDGYRCDATDPANEICVTVAVAAPLVPVPGAPKDDASLALAGGSSCATRAAGADPSKPIPWFAAAVAVAALAARRRGRRTPPGYPRRRG